MYSFIIQNEKGDKKANGINKNLVKNMTHEECEMISYELRVASCKLWFAILRKLIYELRVRF